MALHKVNDAAGKPVHGLVKLGKEGFVGHTFSNPPELCARIWEEIPNLKINEDDVFLCTPVKSGTHWMFEIIWQLLQGKAETSPFPKLAQMIEAVPKEALEALPRPRILNSHLRFQYLPKEVQQGKCKMVLCLRNPLDVFYSMYNHHCGLTFCDYDGEWEDYFPLMLYGKLEYGSWFDIVRDWEERLKENDIHLVYYENLKKNIADEMKRLEEFLFKDKKDYKLNPELRNEIVKKTGFSQMKEDKKYGGELAEKFFKHKFEIFRKGIIGDGKAHCSPKQIEEFEKVFKEKMEGSKLQFQFE